MAIKKSDLYSRLWKSCDELRGGMDASQYKDYILTLLFLKYVSDKAEADAESLIEIPEGCSFDDIVALKGDKEIGDRINKIIAQIANANDLRGVIDAASFNDSGKLGSGKAMVDRLSKLVAIFDELDFRASRAEGDDLLGDAYEYLMRHFATESGKSKGQFYTPAEVSRILAKVVGIDASARQDQTIYDPTCGSGSLLLKAADEAPRGLTVYGQEMDVATWALARMNMILHGYETAEIYRENVITDPGFTRDDQLKRHDFVVANPPFSTKSWNSGIVPEQDEYGRFEYGVPPARNGDYAFLLHAIKSLKSTGKAAVILPHGVLFRGGAEATIRRELLKRGLIKGVVGLPANLFYGTGIPACIVVVDKEGAEHREGIFLVDASRGFKKDGAKNRLRARDIHKIVDVFTRQVEAERYSRLVPLEEISSEANDFNLNIPRYVDASEPEDIQDLDAHLNGGIPDSDLDLLLEYWEAFPSLREQLFEPERPGYSKAKVKVADVQRVIETNADFELFQRLVEKTVDAWWEEHRPALLAMEAGTAPKPIIHALSEDLLRRFKEVPLLSSYDVYERLMAYWSETMQDDVYLISAEGWIEGSKPRGVLQIGESNGKPKYEDPDLTLGSGRSAAKYKMDLLPPEVVVEHYFAEARKALDQLKAEQERTARALDELIEELAVDDGALADVVGENGKVAKKAVTDRIKALKGQSELEEDVAAAEECLRLIGAEAAAKKAAKDAEKELSKKTVAKYNELDEEEIKQLVVDGKWIGAVQAGVERVAGRSIRVLSGRVAEIAKRYLDTLSALEARTAALADRVAEHLVQIEGGASYDGTENY
jgi:type I restriction enzyme M protein